MMLKGINAWENKMNKGALISIFSILLGGKNFEKSGLQNIPSRPTSQLSDRSSKQINYDVRIIDYLS